VSEPGRNIAVVIADDHPVVRGGLRALIASLPGFTVVGEATTGGQAVAAAVTLRPDVIVMDIRMPELDGVEATRRIGVEAPGVAVLVLTMVEDDDTVFAAMQSGARGYLLKGAEQADIDRPCGRSWPARRSSGQGSPAGCSATSRPGGRPTPRSRR
jgi:DNA-binding NarL/FixJ family response regulator